MPDGSTIGEDTAPNASPVQVTGVQVSGMVFNFSASGGAYNWPCCLLIGPEGETTNIVQCAAAPVNGIANISAPLVGLLGVFLDDNPPNQFPPPSALDFSTPGSRNFWTLQPMLRQPFLIGDGLASEIVTQQFVAPPGATRLFLGTLDSCCWSDNSGSFTVVVAALPPLPQIQVQPSSQLGYWGKSVSFSVRASGFAPLSFQWNKDEAPLAGATTNSLILTNLQMSDAGVYSVVITNVYGSVTSNPAILTMNPAGVSFALYGGVTIDGVVGFTYGVQYTTDLSNTNSWLGLANVVLSVPTQLWYDSQPATQPRRYYRVVPGPISIP
jgi:hypothetical protein